MRNLQFIQHGEHAGVHIHFTRTARTDDFKSNHRLAIKQRGTALFSHGVDHIRHFTQTNAATIGQRDLHLRQCLGAFYRGEQAHRLFNAADVGTPPRGLLLHGPQLARNICRRSIQGEQACRVKIDLHFSRHSTHPRDCPYATHRSDGLADFIVNKPGQRLLIHARRGHGIGQDGHTSQINPCNDGIAQRRRQIGAHTGDGIPHVIDGLAGVLFQPELGGQHHRAVDDPAVLMFEPLNAGDRVLKLARHFGFQQPR